MKKLLFLGLAILGFATASAQAPLEQGRAQLNAGVGFSGWGVPVFVGVDYGIHPDFTIGGEFSYRSWSRYSYKASIIGIMGNGNYHFNRVLNIPSNFDFYAGLTLGYYIWNWDHDLSGYTGFNSSDFGFSGQVGGRYFFNNNFGLNVEFGGGSVAGGKFGITYKF